MKIEILYFAGCPHHAPAVQRVREVLEQEGAAAELVEIEIKDAGPARTIGFLGSPTVLVNGRDVEPGAPQAANCGLTCRTYRDDAGGDAMLTGVPPREWIRAAVREARERG